MLDKLPWKISKDMNFFKRITSDNELFNDNNSTG